MKIFIEMMQQSISRPTRPMTCACPTAHRASVDLHSEFYKLPTPSSLPITNHHLPPAAQSITPRAFQSKLLSSLQELILWLIQPLPSQHSP